MHDIEITPGDRYLWTVPPNKPTLKVESIDDAGSLAAVRVLNEDNGAGIAFGISEFRLGIANGKFSKLPQACEKPAQLGQEQALPGLNDNLLIPQSDAPLLGSVEGSRPTLAEEILGPEICATDQDFERATAIPALENFPEVAALVEPPVIPAWAAERWGDDLSGLVGQALEVRQSGVLIAMTVAGVSQGLGGLRLHRTDNQECRDTAKFETFFAKIERGDILVHAETPGRDPVTDATIAEIRAVIDDPSQPFALTERLIEEMPTIEKPKRKPRKAEPTEPTPLPQTLDALRAEEATIVEQIKGLNERLEEVYRLRTEEERNGELRRKREELIRQLAEVDAEMGVGA